MSAHIYNNITEKIGNTPLVRINRLNEGYATILAKVESFNPLSSVKDRIALSMIEGAEASGKLKKGSVIIEPTSGNTGLGLAFIAAVKGYRIIIVMPETMSIERRKLLVALGAELILTEGSLGMKGAIAKAEELAKTVPNSFIPSQFENPDNPKAHYEHTGPEIWEDSGHNVDIFISGVGTGGTLTGVGRYLKEKNPQVKIVAVEPVTSPVLSLGHGGPHKIQGLGAGFVPATLDRTLIDEIYTAEDAKSGERARQAAQVEGLLIGISSGAALDAALAYSAKKENEGKTIVVIFPDTGERYLSTWLFSET
ncbi:cysteine synthase A [Sphaerochaeta sp. PS]|uniref:cysteine synthase A n=1 Tax=Sphaerochaeta sp. PS TaxID=3076336 RepID=UPI0028A3DF53|nr:cysteine synthase A [Sphaerochaeta sp. PS]MDT4762817.1 cysteine synthase A [Sphaerochaeta sp. PS]